MPDLSIEIVPTLWRDCAEIVSRSCAGDVCINTGQSSADYKDSLKASISTRLVLVQGLKVSTRPPADVLVAVCSARPQAALQFTPVAMGIRSFCLDSLYASGAGIAARNGHITCFLFAHCKEHLQAAGLPLRLGLRCVVCRCASPHRLLS